MVVAQPISSAFDELTPTTQPNFEKILPWYSVRTTAVRSCSSKEVSLSCFLLSSAPILARAAARPLKSEVSKDTITLEFNKDYFLDNNGEILKYAVIVAEDPLQNLSYPVPSWNNVHGLPVWPPYVVKLLAFDDALISMSVTVNHFPGDC